MELQCVDDCAIAAHSAEDLQDILNVFAKAYRAMGLALNIKKTQVPHQPPPNQPSTQPTIKVDDTLLKTLTTSPTLAAFFPQKLTLTEVHYCLRCASGAYVTQEKSL